MDSGVLPSRNVTATSIPPLVEEHDDQLPLMFTFVCNLIERYISAYNYPRHHGKGADGDITVHAKRYPQWDDVMTN